MAKQSVFQRRRRVQISGFSIYEVGRSELGQALPVRFPGSVSVWRYLLAALPLVVLALGVAYRGMLFASLGGYRPGYILGAVLMLAVAALLFNHASRLKAYNGLANRYMYAQEHVLPALHYSGVITTVDDTVRLLARETVELDPKQNLYGADMMRVVRLPDGKDIIQFERT